MSKKPLKDLPRAILPKLNKIETSGSLKSPRVYSKIKEKNNVELKKNKKSEKIIGLEKVVEELKSELQMSIKNKQEIELENQNLRDQLFNQLKNSKQDYPNQFKTTLSEKSNIVFIDSFFVKSQENKYNSFNTSLKTDDLISKLNAMDETIKEYKQRAKKQHQEHQIELLKQKKLIENFEKSLKIKDLDIKELKNSQRLLENQKMNFVSSIKDLELQIINLKQSQKFENQDEIHKHIQKITDLENQIQTSEKIKQDLIKAKEDLQKCEYYNSQLLERCKKLENKCERKEHFNFMENYKSQNRNSSETFKDIIKRSITGTSQNHLHTPNTISHHHSDSIPLNSEAKVDMVEDKSYKHSLSITELRLNNL
jgi:regulator of replication initiation timing